ARAHLDQNFIRFDLGIRNLGDLQNVRATMLFEDDCFHSDIVQKSAKRTIREAQQFIAGYTRRLITKKAREVGDRIVYTNAMLKGSAVRCADSNIYLPFTQR